MKKVDLVKILVHPKNLTKLGLYSKTFCFQIDSMVGDRNNSSSSADKQALFQILAQFINAHFSNSFLGNHFIKIFEGSRVKHLGLMERKVA